jgi:hypothetical protein
MGYEPSTSSTEIVLTNLQSSPDGKSTANEILEGHHQRPQQELTPVLEVSDAAPPSRAEATARD